MKFRSILLSSHFKDNIEYQLLINQNGVRYMNRIEKIQEYVDNVLLHRYRRGSVSLSHLYILTAHYVYYSNGNKHTDKSEFIWRILI